MHLANRAMRLGAVMAAAAAIALTLGASTAGAAMAAPVSATPHNTTAQAAAATTAKTQDPPPPPAPSGCTGNNFCEYNSGNGGSLCFQTNANDPGWPGGCADHNEGEYNRNGNAVYMYDTGKYGGCYYLLYSGNYLLYNADDHFEGGGGDCTSETLEHKLVSSKFV
jgi:hypothetical protein